MYTVRMQRRRSNLRLRFATCLLAVLSASAVEADEPALRSATAEGADDAAEPRGRPGPVLDAAPDGVAFRAVRIEGTGCSASDTTPLIRDDGKTVTLYFERFETELTE